MMNLSSIEQGSNVPIYRVSELSKRVKTTITEAFGYVRVRGELGRIHRSPSGHIYFDLKDEDSVLKAVIWKTQLSSVSQEFLDTGMEVISTGSLTTYSKQSCYQLTVRNLQPAGRGAMMEALEKRKKDLSKRGFFKEERKKNLPKFPSCVAVVTSLSGAVVKDILHRLGERFPCLVVLVDVPVQGDECPARVITALDMLEEYNQSTSSTIDVVIIARGGGSFEDLWPFNDVSLIERVGRFSLPLVSAIGHETDHPLLDLVADIYAPTPTAGAEYVARKTREEVIKDLIHCQQKIRQLYSHMSKNIDEKYHTQKRFLLHHREAGQRWHERIKAFIKKNKIVLQTHFQMLENKASLNAKRLQSPQSLLEKCVHYQHHRVPHFLSQIGDATSRKIQQVRKSVTNHHHHLVSLNPEHLLKKGYINVFDMKGNLLTKAHHTHEGMSLRLRFHDGERIAQITPHHE